MAEDRTASTPPRAPAQRPALDKAARKAERARITRLSRLPFLYDFAVRSRRNAVVANLVQAALIVAVVLVPCRVLTGEWLPPLAGVLVLSVALALQAANRYLNARAGRR